MNEKIKRAISGIIYVAIMWFGTSFSKTSFSLLFSFIFLLCLYEMYQLRKKKKKALAFLYVLSPLFLIHFIMIEIILLMFILTWTFDTFAYIVGSKFGKHKIIPNISPHKSWEGFLGGFIFTVIAAYASSNYFADIKVTQIITISLFIPFTATMGDFIESYYKRKAKVKDSGKLIPGHGGILDRMDAFMITIPTIYILINLF